jgi:hypothetical protein
LEDLQSTRVVLDLVNGTCFAVGMVTKGGILSRRMRREVGVGEDLAEVHSGIFFRKL